MKLIDTEIPKDKQQQEKLKRKIADEIIDNMAAGNMQRWQSGFNSLLNVVKHTK